MVAARVGSVIVVVAIAWSAGACGDDPPAAPERAPRALPHSVRLALGPSFSCVLTSAQDVQCWGEVPAEVEGVAEGDRVRSPHPVPVLRGAIEIAASATTLCARMADHQIFCWGEDAETVPVEGRVPGGVRGLEGTRSLAVGGGRVCAIDGETLRCVGHGPREAGTVGRDA